MNLAGSPALSLPRCLLRLHGGLQDLEKGRCRGSLELYAAFQGHHPHRRGQAVPLARDTTIPVAYWLNQSLTWRIGRQQFLSAEEKVRSGVYLTQPYERGRVPVVFVHARSAAPIWWAEMVNTLKSDPVISRRYKSGSSSITAGTPPSTRRSSCARPHGEKSMSSTPRARTPRCGKWS